MPTYRVKITGQQVIELFVRQAESEEEVKEIAAGYYGFADVKDAKQQGCSFKVKLKKAKGETAKQKKAKKKQEKQEAQALAQYRNRFRDATRLV